MVLESVPAPLEDRPTSASFPEILVYLKRLDGFQDKNKLEKLQFIDK